MAATANLPARYRVKKIGRTWSVFLGPKLVEGGFFEEDAALDCCTDWNAHASKMAEDAQSEYDAMWPAIADPPSYSA